MRIKKAIHYAQHLIQLKNTPSVDIVDSFENIFLNDSLITAINIKTKNNCGGGFLVPLYICRSYVAPVETSVYLGRLDMNVFNYLERNTSIKTNTLFDCQQKKRNVLIIQLDSKAGIRNYTCVIPMSDSYEMIEDNCVYNYLENYICFIHSFSREELVRDSLSQLMFSCLTQLNGHMETCYMQIEENIFETYFKKAIFRSNKNDKFVDIYRFYIHKALFENEREESANYVILRYDSTNYLRHGGYRCLSEDSENSQMMASKCFGNKHFQLAIAFRSVPEYHLQFYIHVADNVFDVFLKNSITEEFGYESDFIEYASSDFELQLYSHQVNKTLSLSLKESSLLKVLINLYQNMLDSCDFRVLSYVLNICHDFRIFENLSRYVFANLFQLAGDNFDCELSELYCILFTCITLSDTTFTRVTSSTDLNGGILCIVLYYHTLFYSIVTDVNECRQTVHNSRGLCVDTSWSLLNNFFGSHMKPYDCHSDNFLEIRRDFLMEERGCKATALTCSSVNVSFIRANEFV